MKRTLAIAVAASTLLASAACGDTGDDEKASGGSRTLNVFAAASLTETFGALGKSFESSHPGVKVRFNFGGSSALAAQINQGAPADVFAAASPATMKTVTDAKGAAGTPTTFVKNRLVIAVPPSDPGKVAKFADLAEPGLKVVLCATPVPCGAAAQKALAAAGLKVKPASQEQDVKGVLTKVELGEADAGLVYRTDAKAAGAKVKGIEFPESAKAINAYPIATLARAPQPDLAKQFVDLVLSAPGRTVLTQAGFEAP
ncbi:molybdate ABC transporter substrate-binding protein [Actinomadura parmotrematis]|uniref:Molybdate ABC transporter substrate-binding protein n=1 Tax=Actinomadura parmotrematis TaxID=2864039 RepID=A0ABS7FN36_9ACTN|nr:molybdate ABC transporter substrate-binding protein [Actinomadura parmotrematis]MBW8481179.1 molybdate ABC transporter substrate-binding protein [Actinomadura parmotrematis]